MFINQSDWLLFIGFFYVNIASGYIGGRYLSPLTGFENRSGLGAQPKPPSPLALLKIALSCSVF